MTATLTRWLGGRLTAAVLTCSAVVTITFFLVHLVPGDPVTALLGKVAAPPGAVAQIRRDYGLDQPLLRQFLIYVEQVLHADLGYSYASQQSVVGLILPAAGRTLLLMLPSLVIATLLGVLLGAVASRRPNGALDSAVTTVALVQYSMPVFWVAQILILLFAVNLGWLPAQGMETFGTGGGVAGVVDVAEHMALPVLTITIYYMAIIARISRTSLIETGAQDFVVTARAKGLSARRVRFVHVLRNASIPIVTVVGYSLGEALTGTILTETVFGWPGIGSLFVSAITKRDYPVLEGIFIVTAVSVVVANLMTDLVYGAIDPRLRRQRV